MWKRGKLTVIVGSMFSGKSTELQRQGHRKELAGELVLWFKPSTDDRYNFTAIETHDGSSVNANVVSNSSQILLTINEIEDALELLVGTVLIDEVQFFDGGIVKVIDFLLTEGIDVIVAGLDIDRFGKPFGVVPTLLAKAEEIVKLKAVCNSCGDDAWISVGKVDNGEQIMVGGSDEYVPLCRTCYLKQGGTL